ncbi:MAG: DUF1573 domain-containing protein [Planctomycetaceae bacterium]|nr:DUF1573 domain-containing protein [Planctomycetaceae bacterium]MCB9939096.1 DUF1573 domain-containing protein [Planctomycetaceae bacterium]
MRDRTLLFAFVVVPLLGVTLVTWLSATATFTATWQGKKLEVTRNGRWLYREGLSQGKPTVAASPEEMPRAVAIELIHDFGIMNPLTMGQHAFVIRNEGLGPLVLRKGPTTCKCTLSKLSRGEIGPGEEGVVVLDWNSGRDLLYSHEATIYTNDPNQSELHFGVTGKVRQRLSAVPPTASFGGIAPDGSGKAEVILYSQVWDDFEVVRGECSVAGVSWKVGAVTSSDATLGDVLSARKVTLTTAEGLPQGSLSGYLRLDIQPVEGDAETLELPLDGQVLRRLAVYGPAITMDGVIDAGQVEKGRAKTTRLILKVRDPDRELRVTRITTTPDFVNAKVVAYNHETPDAGIMRLEVEIPSNAPACSYLGVPLGDLRIEFDHPRISTLDLKIKFAVVAQERIGNQGQAKL